MTRLSQGRKSGFRSGWLDCINVQVGSVDIVVNGGNGETAVVFEKRFKNTPSIILKSTEALTDDGILCVMSPTNEGFTAQLTDGTAATYTINWLAVDNQYATRRGGMHGGFVKCMNIQSGYTQLVTDSSGHGTAQTITFKSPFKNVPVVLLTTQEDVSTGKVWISTKPSRAGFGMDVTGSSVTGSPADILVAWVAIDMEAMDGEGNYYGTNLKTTGDYKSNLKQHKAGFRSGYLRCYNIQSGFNTIATDGSGDGTVEAITFSRRMGRSSSLARTPIVFAEPQEADATGNALITSQADTGFSLDVTDSAVVSGNLTMGWIAFCTNAILTD